MIITFIIGGLGNQMFQYAAGLALAEKHRVPLLLDTRLFQNYDLRPEGFLLDKVFEIDAAVAVELEIRDLIGWRASPIGRRLIRNNSLSFLRGNNYYLQNVVAFNREFLSLPSSCYIAGHWLSERFFINQEKLIRKQFTFNAPLVGKNKELAIKIHQTSGAVSLHVRRGDYVNDPHTNANHGTCSIDYYKNAMLIIEKQLNNPIYFVFSDDINWVRKNLPFDQEHTFIAHNQGTESYNDMHLMSLCKHHIIANSSFSWWGAWLNPNPEKIVITPKYWFKNTDWDSRDIAPDNWEQL
jgi:hypothetical protein